MTRIRTSTIFPVIGVLLVATAGIAGAQDQPSVSPQTQNSSNGWQRFSDQPPAPSGTPIAQDPEPVDRSASQDPPPAPAAAPPARPASNRPPAYGLPAELTVRAGTLMTVRVDQMLSSNRNQAGDGFTAVLMQPLVVNGVVVAERGETVYGRVAEALKAHSGKPSQLGLELTGLTLADGTQAPLQSQLVAFQGRMTPAGQQANTVIGTTVLGAAIGAVAGRGTGAAAGAGAGAAAGTLAVLMTRNRPTVIYPETALTFRFDAPLTVATAHAPQAFRFAVPGDYGRPAPAQTRTVLAAPRPAPYVYGSPFYGPYGYPYGYLGPYGYGPGLASA
jgi:hypothetical protein